MASCSICNLTETMIIRVRSGDRLAAEFRELARRKFRWLSSGDFFVCEFCLNEVARGRTRHT